MANPDTHHRAAKRQALLSELAEIGMALARDLPRQAAEPDADLDAIALKYARVSRAVRQTLALEARFEQDTLEWTTKGVRRRGALRKIEVEQLVTRAIESEFSEGVAEHLIDRLGGLLMDDLDEDYADEPVPMLAAQICRALGVPFDPELWADEGTASAPTPAGHPGLRAAQDRDPSAPRSAISSSSPPSSTSSPSPGLTGDSPGGPMNTEPSGKSPTPAFMDGRDRPGHEERERADASEELVGDWSPPRPSG